ncbi:hypothetical protein LEN26_013842 [Aphanomyces euteiches]|uniref:Uncharacterized protein n=1 Tax=Aphanomyces euteiches TaxID=100861 RepID=A0A6G0WF15_9STRA|nr:hypothetical protein Ae201684_015656 [Aphanomyces euteiches]KAH9094250.1 hypothetical protein Ae201684P_016862 [Aphanomyces euteiches]KAH9110133.1 hypothetical protein LEN26_013842 [Aphanomyces euteiches]KAH9111617.1 hypothetical protein AeMF1_013879 [Aphanomyces euteiches]KAH9194920.1 hypothetical protein AeNC1_003094 [Aphanomyces euteiches]
MDENVEDLDDFPLSFNTFSPLQESSETDANESTITDVQSKTQIVAHDNPRSVMDLIEQIQMLDAATGGLVRRVLVKLRAPLTKLHIICAAFVITWANTKEINAAWKRLWSVHFVVVLLDTFQPTIVALHAMYVENTLHAQRPLQGRGEKNGCAIFAITVKDAIIQRNTSAATAEPKANIDLPHAPKQPPPPTLL